MSAVSSVRTPGVLVTAMPRSVAAVTSILSTPLPKLAISFICSPARPISSASMRSVTVGTSTSAAGERRGEFAARHRLVVDVEPGVEQFAHARLDDVGQFARDDHERFLPGHPLSCPPATPRTAGEGLRRAPIHPALTVTGARIQRLARGSLPSRHGLRSRWPVKDKNARKSPARPARRPPRGSSPT